MRKFARSLALVAGLAAPLSMASAQDQFGVGTKLFSVGVLGGGNNFGIGAAVALEVGFKELAPDWTLGLGGSIGFTQKTYSCFAACEYKFRAIPIAALGNVHYKMKDQPKVDLYGGLSLGFTNFSSSSDSPGFNSDNFGASSGLGFGLQVGARYDLTSKVAAMLQLGGGSNTALFFAGLTFKM